MADSFVLSARLRAFKTTVKRSAFYNRLRNSVGYRFLQKRREQKRAIAVFDQGTTSVTIGDFSIALPEKHPLIDWQLSQPYRDQHIGIAAGLFGIKYPNAALIDIGANVGDSAALMASHCQNDLILIEPSPLYVKYLKNNVAQFRNKTVIEEVLIGGESMSHGNLVHLGGTAYLEPGKPGAPKQFATKQLSEFSQDVCLVKCDTDGHDFDIVIENIPWFGKLRPGLIIENQIRTKTDLDQANIAFSKLMSVGYRQFLFFDDPGFMIMGTDSFEQIQALNRYQFKLFEREQSQRSLWNFDVLCCHERDADLFEAVRAYYRAY